MGESAAACRTEQEFGGKAAFAFPAQIFVKSEAKGVGDGDGISFGAPFEKGVQLFPYGTQRARRVAFVRSAA